MLHVLQPFNSNEITPGNSIQHGCDKSREEHLSRSRHSWTTRSAILVIRITRIAIFVIRITVGRKASTYACA
jgi:hypothetical protein